MSTSRKVVALVAVGLLAAPLASQAALVTRQFQFSSTQGALQFGPTIGSFTYDDSVAPVGGGFANATNLFSDLNVAFGTFSFDETTANSGYLEFDASGGLKDAHFGNNCQAGNCTIVAGTAQWWIRVGVPGTPNDFSYSGFNGATGINQTFDNRLLDPVPLPAAAWLLLSGLGGLGFLGRRRKA